MPVISVIVPVYNAQKYIHRCVDSILAQTFTDFELILVDDGSPDNCGAICDEYAAKDDRVRVIHQENQGQAAARNHGVALACSEWICFVDCDDLVHPQILDILYGAVSKHNANLSMCSSVSGDKVPEGFYSKTEDCSTSYQVNESFMKQLFQLPSTRYWVVWCKLIQKKIVQKIPFTEGRIYEDNAIVCQWLLEAKRVADDSNVMYFYCTEAPSTMRNEFNIKKLDYLWAIEEQIKTFRQHDYKEMCKEMCTLHVKVGFQMYLDLRRINEDNTINRRTRKQLLDVWKANSQYIEMSQKELWGIKFRISAIYACIDIVRRALKGMCRDLHRETTR